MRFNEHWSPLDQYNHEYGIEYPEPRECSVEGCHEPMAKGEEGGGCIAHELQSAEEAHRSDPFDNSLWEAYVEWLGIARAEGLAV